jgi:peroxisomal leader peptide-processing protease
MLLPRGALAEQPPLLDRICAVHGHMEGDLALTAASLVEPFLIAEQRDNLGEVGFGIAAVELRSFRC